MKHCKTRKQPPIECCEKPQKSTKYGPSLIPNLIRFAMFQGICFFSSSVLQSELCSPKRQQLLRRSGALTGDTTSDGPSTLRLFMQGCLRCPMCPDPLLFFFFFFATCSVLNHAIRPIVHNCRKLVLAKPHHEKSIASGCTEQEELIVIVCQSIILGIGATWNGVCIKDTYC